MDEDDIEAEAERFAAETASLAAEIDDRHAEAVKAHAEALALIDACPAEDPLAARIAELVARSAEDVTRYAKLQAEADATHTQIMEMWIDAEADGSDDATRRVHEHLATAARLLRQAKDGEP